MTKEDNEIFESSINPHCVLQPKKCMIDISLLQELSKFYLLQS